MDRFGYDPEEATIEKTLGSVYFLLRERVESDFGLLREPAPTSPDYCATKDSDAYRKAITAWQNKLCDLARWTKISELDAYLMSPDEGLLVGN